MGGVFPFRWENLKMRWSLSKRRAAKQSRECASTKDASRNSPIRWDFSFSGYRNTINKNVRLLIHCPFRHHSNLFHHWGLARNSFQRVLFCSNEGAERIFPLNLCFWPADWGRSQKCGASPGSGWQTATEGQSIQAIHWGSCESFSTCGPGSLHSFTLSILGYQSHWTFQRYNFAVCAFL